jgi:hypothetical protein
MGAKASVEIDVTVKQRTPKKIKDEICEVIRERFIPVDAFKKESLSYSGEISFSYSGLAYAESLKLPATCTKYIKEASMTIVYLEQAPSQSFDLISEDEDLE